LRTIGPLPALPTIPGKGGAAPFTVIGVDLHFGVLQPVTPPCGAPFWPRWSRSVEAMMGWMVFLTAAASPLAKSIGPASVAATAIAESVFRLNFEFIMHFSLNMTYCRLL
jgi:hypothetical protein